MKVEIEFTQQEIEQLMINQAQKIIGLVGECTADVHAYRGGTVTWQPLPETKSEELKDIPVPQPITIPLRELKYDSSESQNPANDAIMAING